MNSDNISTRMQALPEGALHSVVEELVKTYLEDPNHQNRKDWIAGISELTSISSEMFDLAFKEAEEKNSHKLLAKDYDHKKKLGRTRISKTNRKQRETKKTSSKI